MTDNAMPWSGRLTARWRRMQDAGRRFGATIGHPRPRVDLDLRRSVPGWLVRLVTLGIGVATLLVLHPPIFGLVVLLASLLVLAVYTAAITGLVYCGLVGLTLLLGSALAWPAEAAVIALGTATWMLAGMMSGLGPRARIEVAAILPTLWRYLIIQAITQLLLAGTRALQSLQLDGPGAAVVAVCCGAGMAAVGWLVLPRLSRD